MYNTRIIPVCKAGCEYRCFKLLYFLLSCFSFIMGIN